MKEYVTYETFHNCRWNYINLIIILLYSKPPVVLHLMPFVNPSTCSFVHLLSSLIFLSLPLLYFPLVIWSGTANYSLSDVIVSEASFPSFADVLSSAWKTPARLSNKVQSTEIHLNHHFLQRAFSDALRMYLPHPPHQAELKTCSASYLFYVDTNLKGVRLFKCFDVYE